ncbi:MAG TPA: hypothetical protein VNM41_07690 [Solirubrobacterales bacterium]|nr:hypothetical protein [Solirubrobacterales bacterium]
MGGFKVKAALLAVAVAVVVGAAPASASAAEFKAGAYPATLTGSQLAGERIQTFFGGSEVVCETATLAGTLAAASAEVLVHPVFGTCKAFGFVSATFTTTGCNYKVHVGALEGTDIWDGSYDIVCEAGKSIRVTAGTCELEIKSVNGIKELDLIDETGAAADMTWRPLLANIPYTVTKDGVGCPLASTGNFNNGSGIGRYTVTATAGGGATKFEVS